MPQPTHTYLDHVVFLRPAHGRDGREGPPPVAAGRDALRQDAWRRLETPRVDDLTTTTTNSLIEHASRHGSDGSDGDNGSNGSNECRNDNESNECRDENESDTDDTFRSGLQGPPPDDRTRPPAYTLCPIPARIQIPSLPGMVNNEPASSSERCKQESAGGSSDAQRIFSPDCNLSEMAERWLAAHASSVQNSRSFAGGNNSISSSQRDPLRASVAHDSAHESEDVPRRTPGLRRVDGPSLIEASPGRSERAFRSGNERLYEAYNDLHALAQDFEKPFDAPAILVVGHQTDGKSGTCVVLLVTEQARLAIVPQWQSSPVATVPQWRPSPTGDRSTARWFPPRTRVAFTCSTCLLTR